MDIAVTYNQPQNLMYGERKDKLSEDAVLDEVSDVEKALRELGHQVSLLPLKDDASQFIQRLAATKPDCIFNLVESAYGISHFEMNLPSLYELIKIPYSGSPPLALGNCLDKVKSKYILLGAGLPTPKFDVINNPRRMTRIPPFPLIVKPSREDASIGISSNSVVFDESSLKDRVNYILTEYNQPVLIESYVDGIELNVSLIGNESPKILSISEIDFSKLRVDGPKIVTYDGKWDEKSLDFVGTPVVCPAELDNSLKKKVEVVSKKAYKILGCRGYARIDFRVNQLEEPFIIDLNSNPDISKKAGFARSAEKSGISYYQLIQMIVNLALQSYSEPDNLYDPVVVRKISKEDVPLVVRMLKKIGIFRKMEIKVAIEIVNSYFNKQKENDYSLYVADYGANRAVGYICFGPTPLTEGTYDIYWIVVTNRFRGIGIGVKLLIFAENYIRKLKGRKIFIDTSSKKGYELARRFYEYVGYRAITRIPNFYSEGDDKIIYEKELNSDNLIF